MNSYREKKERERLVFSCLTVLGATILLLIIAFLLEMLRFEDFNEYTGPVKITFGSPDGIRQNETVKELITQKVNDEVIQKEDIADEPVPEVESETVESKPEVVTNDLPKVEKTEEVDIVKKVIEKPVVEPTPVVQRGRESGNSHETSFESSSSKIGRRAYFPIVDFMPLPKTVTLDIFALIQADESSFNSVLENKTFFKTFYFDRGTYFSLNSSVPFQDRPDLWLILKRAGYDVENAEYKTEIKLKNIIISFEINSNSNGANAIKSAAIESSSGNQEIDKAVLYGFRQSTYSNSTDDTVKGRFKYTFK